MFYTAKAVRSLYNSVKEVVVIGGGRQATVRTRSNPEKDRFIDITIVKLCAFSVLSTYILIVGKVNC